VNSKNMQRRVEILKEAEELRSRLDSLSTEFVHLHGLLAGSDDADELMHCVFDGSDYEKSLRRIINWRCQMIAAEDLDCVF
jgi:hypothetical protein